MRGEAGERGVQEVPGGVAEGGSGEGWVSWVELWGRAGRGRGKGRTDLRVSLPSLGAMGGSWRREEGRWWSREGGEVVMEDWEGDWWRKRRERRVSAPRAEMKRMRKRRGGRAEGGGGIWVKE